MHLTNVLASLGFLSWPCLQFWAGKLMLLQVLVLNPPFFPSSIPAFTPQILLVRLVRTGHCALCKSYARYACAYLGRLPCSTQPHRGSRDNEGTHLPVVMWLWWLDVHIFQESRHSYRKMGSGHAEVFFLPIMGLCGRERKITLLTLENSFADNGILPVTERTRRH